MKSLWIAFLLAGCSTLVTVPEVPPSQASLSPEDAWRKTLAANVDDKGQVDFKNLKRDSSALRLYVASLAKDGPKLQASRYNTREKRLAFYINAYNALTLYGVLESGVPDTLSSRFLRKKFIVEGAEVTLEDYRDRTIRALGDERVSVALSYLTKSSAKLLRYPYFSEWIHEELEKQSATFFNDEQYVRKDASRKVVRVTGLMKYYAEDYLRKSPTLIAYINRYRKDKIPADFKVEFLPFDWALLAQPRSPAKAFSKAHSTVSEG